MQKGESGQGGNKEYLAQLRVLIPSSINGELSHFHSIMDINYML